MESKISIVLKYVKTLAQIFFIIFFFAVVLSMMYSSRPVVESKKLKPNSALCLTQLLSVSDGASDKPPYGHMVFIDDHGCVADSYFKKKKATQVFGGYCHEISIGWEANGSAKITCAIPISDFEKNVVLQVKKYKSTDILFEFIDEANLKKQ